MENIGAHILQNFKSAGPHVLPIAMENIGALVLQNTNLQDHTYYL
jgi:hypothetical protein